MLKMNWIKVTDKLPDDEQKVIACGYEEDADKTYLIVDTCEFNKETKNNSYYFELLNNHCCSKFNLHHVTHWMPLPYKPTE